LGFFIQQDKVIYQYYPSGFLQALSKLGGLLAILKVGIIIESLHKRWFNKEVAEIIAKNNIKAEQDEGESMEIKKIYSIEQFNNLMKRVK